MKPHHHGTQRPALTVAPMAEGESRRMLATAYWPAFDRMNGGDITASGRHVHAVQSAREDGLPVTIAVDRRVIPLGSTLTISEFPGLVFDAADTGGRINNDHIDISMSTGPEAKNWGKRYVTVTLVSVPPRKVKKKHRP